MGSRGEKLGMEYRYVLDEQSKGTLMVDFLDDRQVDDGTPGSEKWGYTGDGYLRPNSDRYWFRMKHDQALSHGFFSRLDIDFVSDQDYFHEFKDGYAGFDEADEYYIREFGRGFDAYDDHVRLNRFNVSRSWSLYSLNAELRWYDDVIKRRQEETDTTLQRLPVITFNGLKQDISTSPIYFDLASEYTYFYSEDGPRNHRMDIYPSRNIFIFIWHHQIQKNKTGHTQRRKKPSESYRSIRVMKECPLYCPEDNSQAWIPTGWH
jgi:LPS-assembly protein